MSERRVIVIGGGLAGISAAIALREAGAAVTLLEARPRLGGATTSFRRGELAIDNGQHVYLACCTAYRALLDRLGVSASAPLQDRFDVTVLAPGRTARLRRTQLPGPLQLGKAMATYRHLSLAERAGAARATLGHAVPEPGGPGHRREAPGRLAGRARAGRARAPRAVGSVHRVHHEHRRGRREPGAGGQGRADRADRQAGRGRHRLGRDPAGRAARHRVGPAAGPARRRGPAGHQRGRGHASRPAAG